MSDLLLGLDASTPLAAVAVCAPGDGGSLAERTVRPGPEGRPRHGTGLLGAVEDAVAEAGGWERIGSIVTGVGPGSFTGMRIAVSTARALAQARALPLVGVTSTAALAAGVADDAPPRLGVIDARRGEIFAELMGPGGDRSGPVVCAPGELTAALPGARGARAAGDGAVRFRGELEAQGVEVLADRDPAHELSGRALCGLAEVGSAGPPESVGPLYLRRPDAERWIAKSSGD